MESLQRIHFPLMAAVLLAALAALPSDITCEIFAASEKMSGPVRGFTNNWGADAWLNALSRARWLGFLWLRCCVLTVLHLCGIFTPQQLNNFH